MSDFESSSTATFPMPGAASRMAVGDFDNDGDADILYQTVGGGSPFQYARSNGDGTFTIVSQTASPFIGLTLPDNGGGTFYAGDFDGDGDTDIVATVANSTGFYFRNDNGTFASASSATLPAAATAFRFVTGDFDGDGDEDILYQTAGDGSAFQYARSNGNGTFTIVTQAASPFAGVGTLPNHNGSNYLSGDFDGDGDIDLLATPNGTSGFYYSNNGNGTFSSLSTATFPAPAAGGRMTAGDFDTDGDLDILYQTGGDGSAFQYARSNGDGTFTILAQASSPFAGLSLPNHGGGNFFAADFDGDGDTDLLAGVNGGTGSYFYQVGKPPEIASSTPADNATGVAPTANIQIVFDEAVNKGSGNIYLYRADHTLIETISVSSVQVSGSGTTWTIDPSVTLAGNTGYYIRMDAGTFADTGGAIFAGVDDSTTLNFITAAPNLPPAGVDNATTIFEDGGYTFTASDFGFSDTDGNSLQSVLVTTTPGAGTLYYDSDGAGGAPPVTVTPGTAVAAGVIDAGNFYYVPALNGNGTGYASFTFQVVDNGGTAGGGSNIDPTPNTFTINVNSVNDAPSGANATIQIDEDSTYVLKAADFGFSDVDGNSLQTVILVTLPGAGTLYYDPDGPGGISPITFSGGTGFTLSMLNGGGLYYVPEADANGAGYASFAFQVVDNGGTANGGSNIDPSLNTLTFDVAAVEDLPTAVADTPTVNADMATAIAVIANDTDPDGGAKAVIEINGSGVSIGVPVTLASGATVTLNADGTIGYDPNGRFDDLVSQSTALLTGASNYSATDSFSYTLNGGSSTTVTVTVMGVDEAGDALGGTTGGDVINGTAGNDAIWGFEGFDFLAGGDGDDVVYGNDGADILGGGANNDRLYGGNDADNLMGDDGDDVLIGNHGADIMSGGLGDDVYYVDEAGDTVSENFDEGTDTVRAQVDYTLTDDVENLFIGGAARNGTGNGLDNTLHGSESSNTLSGLAGDDVLRGGGGRDVLLGGGGEDMLDGGAGKDLLIGGADRDVFQFHDGDMGTSRPLADLIADFSQADSEKIQLSLVDADTGTSGDQGFAFVGTAAFTGTAGELRYQVALGDTWISADTDGDGAADWYIGLSGMHTLSASDFVL